jgi:hypothetical protein
LAFGSETAERHEGKTRRLMAHQTCRMVMLDKLHGMESWGRQRQSGRRDEWMIMQGMEIVSFVSCGAVGKANRAVHACHVLAGITQKCSSFSAPTRTRFRNAPLCEGGVYLSLHISLRMDSLPRC